MIIISILFIFLSSPVNVSKRWIETLFYYMEGRKKEKHKKFAFFPFFWDKTHTGISNEEKKSFHYREDG